MEAPERMGVKIVLITEKLIKDWTSLSITKSEINWNRTNPIAARCDDGAGPGRSIYQKIQLLPKKETSNK